MKLPLRAPSIQEMLKEEGARLNASRILKHRYNPLIGSEYAHWDKIFHMIPPDGLNVHEWWFGIKRARQSILVEVPLYDASGQPFSYAMVDPIFESLHKIDLGAGGRIEVPGPIIHPSTRDRYYVNSLIEEAITSSQIEGAGTTRQVAKEMIRSNRPPQDRGERMILNNYQTMRRMGEIRDHPLTPELVMDIHRLVTQGTLEQPSAAGRFRQDSEEIVVGDLEGNVLHKPPCASELPDRLEALCRFANGGEPKNFVHPVVRSMILHFWLAYDHPFVDGNGRTARALFYWSMLHHGFWLFEFISISTIIRKAKRQYLHAFLQTETDDNDLTYFLIYHLRIIESAIDALQAYLKRQADRTRFITAQMKGFSPLNHRQKALVAHALRHPGVEYTIQSHQRSHDVAYQTARTDLLALVQVGLFVQAKIGKSFVFSAVPELEERLGAT